MQSETIIIPETKETIVKQAKTKKKNETDQKDKNLDINQVLKKVNKNKGNTAKGRKCKNSSSKMDLDQPCQAQPSIDENKNLTNTNSENILPADKINPQVLITDDEPESLPEDTGKKKVILDKNLGENLGNKSLKKRGNLSSISSEPSPEYVPEYCDETLAYDICAEEEFGFFGDTNYFVKDDIGYEKSGIGAMQGTVIAEGCRKGDANSMKENKVHMINDEGYVRSDRDVRDDGTHGEKNEIHVKGGEGQVKDEKNHITDCKSHVKGGEGHVKGIKGCVKDDNNHVKDDGHVKGDEGHMKDIKDHVKDNNNHVKDDGHAKGDEGHVKDIKDHEKDDNDHVKDDNDHVKDDGHVKGDEGLVKDNKDHMKDNEEHVKYNNNHVKDDNDHVKDDNDDVKDDEGHVKGDESHVKDDNDLVREDHHVKDGYHENDNDENVKHGEGLVDDKNHVEVEDDHVTNCKGSDDHVNDNKDNEIDNNDHARDDEEIPEENYKVQLDDGVEGMEVDSGHGNDEEDHVKGGKDYVKGGKDHVEETASHGKDGENAPNRDSHAEQLVKDDEVDESIIQTVLPVTEIETKQQEQKNDVEKDDNIPPTNTLKVEHPLNSSTNNDKLECILIGDSSCASSEGDVTLLDTNIEGVNSQDDKTPSETGIFLEKDTGLEPLVGDIPLGCSASSVKSIDVDQTMNVDHQRDPNLKLKIRSSSLGSTCLTDSECMSPEFVQLPEPKKGVFDTVFATEINDSTEDLTVEMKNEKSEIREHISKNTACNTAVQEVCEDDLCHEPKKELQSDDRQKDFAVIAENKTVDCSVIHEVQTCDSDGLKPVETKVDDIVSKKSQGRFLDTTQDKPIPNKDGENEESCPKRSLSPTSQQRRLSDEETALCLLDLSCAESGKATEINEIKFQAPSKDITKNSNIVDVRKQNKQGVVEASVSCDPLGGLTRNKDKKETSQQQSLKRKPNENKNETYKKRGKVLVNIPFMVQGSGNEVIDLLQDLKEHCVSPSERNEDFKSQSSTVIDKRKVSTTDPVVINEFQNKNNVVVVATSDSSHGLPSSKEVRSTLCVKEQGFHHSDKKRHKTSTSSRIKSKTLSVPIEETSSKNISEKKPKRLFQKNVEGSETTESKELKARRVEGKSESALVKDEAVKKHNTEPVTSSSFEKNKSELVSSRRRLTKSQEGFSSNEAETKDAQHIQTTTISSVSLGRCSSGGDDANIPNVHSKEKYDVNMQGINSLSWSNDSSKTYPYSAHLKPPPLNQVNPNLYPAGFNSFIVSHLNQKGFYPQANFPFTTPFNQPHPSNPSNLVNQRPFSAVPGLNWYPDSRPRPVGLITAPMFVSNQLYFLPNFSASSQLSQQTLHNNTYGRALQEIAKRKQTENFDEPVSDNEEFSSSIDSGKAWYAKDVGSSNRGISSHDIKDSGEIIACVQSQINIQAREYIDRAEKNNKVLSGIDRSNNIVVSITESTNNDAFSSAVVKTRPSAEKSNARSSFCLQQIEFGNAKEEEGSLTGKCGESPSNKHAIDGNHRQGDIAGESSGGELMVLHPDVDNEIKKNTEQMKTIDLTGKSEKATYVEDRRTSSESKVAGSLSANNTKPLDHTVSKSAKTHATDNGRVIKKTTENSESIQKSLQEMKISKSIIERDKSMPESIPDSLSVISTKPLQLTVSKAGISDPTVTSGGIDESKDQVVHHGKHNLTSNSEFNQESSLRETKSSSENSKTVTQFKEQDRDQDHGKTEDKTSLNSESKQKPFLEETESPKSASKNGKRCSKERERSRESLSNDQKERTKIASHSKEEDRRNKWDIQEKDLNVRIS